MHQENWAKVKVWVEQTMLAKGLSQRGLADKIGLSSGAISQFLRTPDRELARQTMAKLESVLGLCPVPGMSVLIPYTPERLQGEGLQAYDTPTRAPMASAIHAPVVELRRIPVGLVGERFREAIKAMSATRIPVPIEDPDAFWVALPEGVGGYKAGTLILISPGTPSLPNDEVLVEHHGKISLANITSLDGVHRVVVGGQAVEARIIGKLRGDFRWR